MTKLNNSIGLRLNKRINWSYLWCSDDINNSKITTTTKLIEENTNKISKLLAIDELILSKTNKCYLAFRKNVNLGYLFTENSIRNRIQIFNRKIPRITDRNKGIKFETFKYLKIKNEMLQIVSAKYLSNYIAYQIKASTKSRDAAFNKSIATGIFTLIRHYFGRLKNYKLNGLSIICSGRWIKTRTGRKQKLKVTIGKTKKQTNKFNIDYSLTSLTSKFGVFSVKVWISYSD